MRVERRRGRKVFTPRAIELQRQFQVLQPAVDACRAERARFPEGSRFRYGCDRSAAECPRSQANILRSTRDAGLGIKPWEDFPDELVAELDRIAAG